MSIRMSILMQFGLGAAPLPRGKTTVVDNLGIHMDTLACILKLMTESTPLPQHPSATYELTTLKGQNALHPMLKVAGELHIFCNDMLLI